MTRETKPANDSKPNCFCRVPLDRESNFLISNGRRLSMPKAHLIKERPDIGAILHLVSVNIIVAIIVIIVIVVPV